MLFLSGVVCFLLKNQSWNVNISFGPYIYSHILIYCQMKSSLSDWIKAEYFVLNSIAEHCACVCVFASKESKQQHRQLYSNYRLFLYWRCTFHTLHIYAISFVTTSAPSHSKCFHLLCLFVRQICTFHVSTAFAYSSICMWERDKMRRKLYLAIHWLQARIYWHPKKNFIHFCHRILFFILTSLRMLQN